MVRDVTEARQRDKTLDGLIGIGSIWTLYEGNKLDIMENRSKTCHKAEQLRKEGISSGEIIRPITEYKVPIL